MTHTNTLHLILHFLGGIRNECVPALQRSVSIPFTPFTLSIGMPKLWPHGILVLQPHEEPPKLLQLRVKLASELLALGSRPEALSINPHMTLARRANHEIVQPEVQPLSWDVCGYPLVKSSPSSRTYLPIQNYCFDGTHEK